MVERRVHSLTGADGVAEFEDLSRFLLRSEAIASSQIEGIAPAAKQILPRLAGSPVLTIKTASEIHDLSLQKAYDALIQLKEAGIMTTKSIARGTHAYIANDVLDLITTSSP